MKSDWINRARKGKAILAVVIGGFAFASFSWAAPCIPGIGREDEKDEADLEVLTLLAVAAAGGGANSAPTGLTITPGDTLNTIGWDAVQGASSYNIFFNTTGSVSTASSALRGVTSPYTHSGLTNGTRYYYVVTAVRGNRESDPSTEKNGVPRLATCGNGAPNAGETCDDGSNNGATSCSYGTPTCNICNESCTANVARTGPYCGDGITNGSEACDDRNTNACGPCNAVCAAAGAGTCAAGIGCNANSVCTSNVCLGTNVCQ